MDAWDQSIQTRMAIDAAIACFKYAWNAKNVGIAYAYGLEENCRATHGSLSPCPKPRNLPSTQFRTSSWRIPGKMIWLITGDAMQVCEVMTFMAIAVHVKLMQGTGPTFSGDHGCHT